MKQRIYIYQRKSVKTKFASLKRLKKKKDEYTSKKHDQEWRKRRGKKSDISNKKTLTKQEDITDNFDFVI